MTSLRILLDDENPVAQTALFRNYYPLNWFSERELYDIDVFCSPFFDRFFDALKFNPSSCLEIGAGGRANLSRALVSKGKSMSSLDIKWGPHQNVRLLTTKEKEQAYQNKIQFKARCAVLEQPFILNPAYKDQFSKINFYVGDVADALNDDSPLKNRRFDFVYFWGSLFPHESFNQAIGASENFSGGRNLPLEDRTSNALGLLKDRGVLMLAGSNYASFNPGFHPGAVRYNNIDLTKMLVWLATTSQKKPYEIDLIGLSEAQVLRTNNVYNECFRLARKRIGKKVLQYKMRNDYPLTKRELRIIAEKATKLKLRGFEQSVPIFDFIFDEQNIYSESDGDELYTDNQFIREMHLDLATKIQQMPECRNAAGAFQTSRPNTDYERLLKENPWMRELIEKIPPMMIDMVVMKY